MGIGMAQNAFAQNAKTLMREWIGTRKQIAFLLDLSVERDSEAFEIIGQFKSKRVFLPSVITGLKIVYELKNARVDTLLKEYPDVVEWLRVKLTPTTTPPDTSGVEQRLDNIERLLLEREIPPTGTAIMQPLQPLTNCKTLTSKPLPLPEDDDDPLPVIATKVATSNSSMNFVNALQNLH